MRVQMGGFCVFGFPYLGWSTPVGIPPRWGSFPLVPTKPGVAGMHGRAFSDTRIRPTLHPNMGRTLTGTWPF